MSVHIAFKGNLKQGTSWLESRDSVKTPTALGCSFNTHTKYSSCFFKFEFLRTQLCWCALQECRPANRLAHDALHAPTTQSDSVHVVTDGPKMAAFYGAVFATFRC